MANTDLDLVTVAKRRGAVADAVASVRLEGLDPSAVEPVMDAWARGELTVDQMVAAGLAIAQADADASQAA